MSPCHAAEALGHIDDREERARLGHEAVDS
jgi:hypothetical protein